MFTDVVFPNNNEDEFISIATKLGYNALCFVYEFDRNKIDKYKELIKNEQSKTKLKLYLGFLVYFNEINKAEKHAELILVQNSEKNREVLEKSKADLLFDLETQNKRDFIHHRASGLNHVLCNLANKNKKIIGFSFNSILNSKNRWQLLGRISQNIKLCRKYKVKTLIASFARNPFKMRSVSDLISLFVALGMHQKEAKDSLRNIFNNKNNQDIT